jgi:Rrf2 family iron-sulfur cluster assembly transcriptional regulator
MLLTTKGRYAVMAVIEIAGNDSTKPIALSAIAQTQDISLSYLEQIFMQLKNAGIVKAIRGPGGGYVLARPSNEITIADIIKATGESIKMTRCSDQKKSCNISGVKCKTHHLWRGLEDNIYAYLNSITLNDICK